MKLVCKLFGFILVLFTAAVDGVGYALKTVGTVLVDTVDGVLSSASKAIGLPKLVLYGGLAAGAWFLMKASDDDNAGGNNPPPQIVRSNENV